LLFLLNLVEILPSMTGNFRIAYHKTGNGKTKRTQARQLKIKNQESAPGLIFNF